MRRSQSVRMAQSTLDDTPCSLMLLELAWTLALNGEEVSEAAGPGLCFSFRVRRTVLVEPAPLLEPVGE